MADLDEDRLVVNVGDFVRLCDGEKGVVMGISQADTNFGFDRYAIKLNSGKIATEARYRFDVIPSCPGHDVSLHRPIATETRSVTVSQSVTFSPPVANDECNEISDKDSLDDFDIDAFIESEANKNTKKKTDGDVKKVGDFFQNVLGEKRAIEAIHLSKLLCIFFIKVRNQKGEEYEPASIRNIACSLDRYLKTKDYGKQIASSPEFTKVMNVIRSKQKKIKREGKGNLEKRADAISDKDIDKLYETRQLGTGNPDSLLRTVWLNNTVHFGMRGVTKHRDMRWGDVKLCKDSKNNEYIEFRERQTKTRPGSNPKNVRAVPPRAWAIPQNPSRCPVATYKSYQARRPPTYSSPDDPYYVSTKTNCNKSSKWFKCQPVGINKLGKFMSTMAENAGLTSKSGDTPCGKRLTNHSARKYLVQKLSDKGLPRNQIMQISGHKNIQSINSYSTINANQHRTISRVLSNSEQAVSPVVDTPNEVPGHGTGGPAIPKVLSNKQNAFPLLFGGHIYGGTFTININNTTSVSKKGPRPMVVYSSDSD